MVRPVSQRILLGAAAVSTAIILTACASAAATPRPTARPSASPGASPSVTASGSPGASPAASQAAAACGLLDIDATITSWEGAAGSRIATVDVKNVGGSTCDLGAPTAETLLDGLAAPPIKSTGDKAVGSSMTLGNDQTAKLLVSVANWCSARPSDPVSIGLTLAGGSSFVAEPAKGVTFDPPPCNSSSQPTTLGVQASGWSATATVRRADFSPRRAVA
jgi:hypothetical protein